MGEAVGAAMGRLAETIEQSARALRDGAEQAAARSVELVETALARLEEATTSASHRSSDHVAGLTGQLTRDAEAAAAALQGAAAVRDGAIL